MLCHKCGQPIDEPRHAGKPWTRKLDADLKAHAEMLRDREMQAEEAIYRLADRFGRSRGSITARLVKLDLITP